MGKKRRHWHWILKLVPTQSCFVCYSQLYGLFVKKLFLPMSTLLTPPAVCHGQEPPLAFLKMNLSRASGSEQEMLWISWLVYILASAYKYPGSIMDTLTPVYLQTLPAETDDCCIEEGCPSHARWLRRQEGLPPPSWSPTSPREPSPPQPGSTSRPSDVALMTGTLPHH